jgi:ketosteroid isomerase-like protein
MSDEEQVRRASERFYEALNRLCNGDPSAMQSVWHQDATVTTAHPMGDWARGWDEVWVTWDEIGRMVRRGSIKIRDMHVAVHGDVAYTTGVEEVDSMFGPTRVRFSANTTNIYVRRGGEWRMVHHHADRAPAAEKAIDHLAE